MKALARAEAMTAKDGGAGPSLSEPFAVMVGSTSVIGPGKAAKKCEEETICARWTAQLGNLQAIGVSGQHQALFAHSSPSGSYR